MSVLFTYHSKERALSAPSTKSRQVHVIPCVEIICVNTYSFDPYVYRGGSSTHFGDESTLHSVKSSGCSSHRVHGVDSIMPAGSSDTSYAQKRNMKASPIATEIVL